MLYAVNPVGFGSMAVAAGVSIVVFFGGLGAAIQPYSPLVAIGLALVLPPILALATRGQVLPAPRPTTASTCRCTTSTATRRATCCTCHVCRQDYERPDMTACADPRRRRVLAVPEHRQGRRPRPTVAVVNFTPADVEKLLLSVAGMVARDRLARGVRLNHPEAVALLSTWVIERAREGALVADLMEQRPDRPRPDDVMHGVADMLHDVQVEATFPDGRKLVTIHSPII